MFESDALISALLFLLIVFGHIIYVAPCWIIAVRKNVAPSWIHWVIPFWNLFTAYRVGKGSLKLMLATVVLFFLLWPILLSSPGIAMALIMAIANGFSGLHLVGALAFLFALLCLTTYGLYLFALWKWAQNISGLAEANPTVLSVLLVLVPTGVPLVCSLLLLEGAISPAVSAVVSPLAFVLAWGTFLVIAFKTPKVDYLADFSMVKE